MIIEQSPPHSLQTEVGEWAQQTFPGAGPIGELNHLSAETKELYVALIRNIKARQSGSVAEILPIADEAADCLLLLFCIAHRYGFDLIEAAHQKHQVNLTRRWAEPDENGITQHIRETQP